MAIPRDMRGGESPAKISITNLQTKEMVVVQYNPPKLEPEVSANYERKAVLGQSHQPLQYTGTGNLVFTLELYLDAVTLQGKAPSNFGKENPWGWWPKQAEGVPKSATASHVEAIASTANFLQSLLYSDIDDDIPNSGEPPDCLVVWPGTLTAVCKATAYKGSHTQFNLAGQTIRMTVSITFEENRKNRLLQADVRGNGLRRIKGVP